MTQTRVTPYLRECYIEMAKLDESLAGHLLPETLLQIRSGAIDHIFRENLEGGNTKLMAAMEIAGISAHQAAKAIYTYGSLTSSDAANDNRHD